MRLLMLLLTAGMVFAQDKPAEPPAPATPKEAAVIPIKTLTGDSFDRLVSMLQVFNVNYRGDSQLRTIIVYAPKETIEQMRRVIEQLDRPGSEAAIGRNIDMTLTLLHCGAALPSAAALPSDMESVVKQLRTLTTCKDPQVWETIPMRLQEGKRSSEELGLPGAIVNGMHASASMQIYPEAVFRKEQERYVRFSTIVIGIKMPIRNGADPRSTAYMFTNLSINTSGDFREGQKTVLGKVSGSGDDDSVFAVVALKILD